MQHRSRDASYAVLLSLLVFAGAAPGMVRADPWAETPVLSDTDQASLFRLAKVWGYLKYHHPAVRRGCLDWDAELLEALPGYLGGDDAAAVNGHLERWLVQMDARDCEPGTDAARSVHFSVDQGWLRDPDFLGAGLRARLDALHALPRQGGLQHYVGAAPGPGNPVFTNDRAYADLETLHWGHRLLALFRYWNIIEYWFPYRDQVDGWDDTLREFIPRFVAAERQEGYRLQLMALVARVEDGHANVWSLLHERPPAGDLDVAAHIRCVEGKPVVWKVLENGGAGDEDENRLRLGDVILAVDGTPVDALFARWRPYYGASNEASLMRDLCWWMLRGAEERVNVIVDRDGTEIALRLRRGRAKDGYASTHDRDGEAFQSLGEGIGYLKLSAVEDEQTSDYVAGALEHRALVIDIRNYPSAFMVFALGQHLVGERTPFARFTNADLRNPGTFRWTPDPLALEPREPRFQGRIVILVDELTMSQAEYTAMAFRAAPGAVVVGSRTAGADGDVSVILLPGGHRTGISGIGVFYPDRTPTQKIGIVPDIEVLPTIAGIRAGRDEVLEAAAAHVLGREASPERVRALSRRVHAATPK